MGSNPLGAGGPDGRARNSTDAAPAGSAAPALPSIALPKGGGALRGIGEKLTIGPSGSASLSVPLPVSPARSPAATPQLALSYDSSSGNGPFGLGWTLSLPAIARKTEKALPRYRDGDDSDTFVLAGVEDLVPVLVESGGAWIRQSIERDGYRVERYRPRVEAGFARIERWTEKGTGVAHWRTTSGDNVTSLYGRSDAARIADPADATRVFSWLLEETRDDKGNVVAYEYKEEDATAVDPTRPDERNRLAAAGFANRYLKRVHYGNQEPFVAADWCFELAFDYGDHDEEAPTLDGDRPWPARLDPFSSYRAGFEIRTYRLCRRVLLFHVFEALGGSPELVRSLDLQHQEGPALTTVTSIAQTGYLRDGAGYRKKSLPPLALGYTAPAAEPALQVLDAASAESLPAGLAASYQWVDLDSEGMSGVLTEQAQGWFYKRNLGGGELGAVELVSARPRSGLRPGAQLLDLAGDGRKCLVELSGPMPGYYRRQGDPEPWSPFSPFASMPALDWNGGSHRLIDLDGDGLADVLVTEDEVWSWHPSLGTDGFGPRETVPAERDEERGPALVFADATQSIFLGDFSGDGLVDIARIRNGEVCYWPNLGYGRFGAKVTMANAPVFDHPDLFDPKRIRLADVDGTGTTDLLYLGRGEVLWWTNQAGNGWGAPDRFAALPHVDDVSAVAAIDFLGNGTTCLVWSSYAPRDAGRPLAYLDLMGGQKPYLLASVRNNLGAEMALGYASSTKFYAADRAAGEPWATRLPFPVQVLERAETRDLVTGNRFVSTYSYHHGHYDGVEREFRGFARIDQLDTEEYAPFAGAGLLPAGTNLDEALHVPPVWTRTWYHTGAWLDGARIETALAAEYWSGDTHPQAVLLPDTVMPDDLTVDEEIQACRALRGRILRQEIYALDDGAATANPYSVSERSYAVRRLQPLAGNRHAVFFSHPREQIDFHYERTADPRVGHALTLEVDDLGCVRRAISIAYPRRGAAPFPEQTAAAVVYSETDLVHVTDRDDWYRVGVPLASRSYEVVPAVQPAARYQVADVEALLAGLAEIAYEAAATPGTRRLIGRSESLYCRDDLGGPLPFGQVESLALPYESYQLALTPGLVPALWGGRVTDAMLSEARYLARDGGWWVPSGRLERDAARFWMPVRFLDPFGNIATVAYDDHALLVTRTETSQDPVLRNVATAVNDYRTLSPVLVTDANGNRTAARTDELGLVIATAAMGKETGPAEGDTLDDPTTRLEYDLAAVPAFVHAVAREQHGAANPRWQESYQYSDGFGRVVQKKVQAEPDPQTGGARWVGTGRTVFDNKGLPVKQYEPFFSSTSAYEDEAAVVESGVTPILHHDPLGRLIRTDQPDGSFSLAVFDAWEQESWDRNDTVFDSRWHLEHSAATASAEDRRAAQLAAAHASTPAITHVDPLGRAFLVIADNGPDGACRTRSELDIQGNTRRVIDHFDRTVMSYGHTMTGLRAYQRSMDAGEHWMLADVAGKPVRSWDSRGHVRRIDHDLVQRPTHGWLSTGGGAELLVERTVYGEQVTGGADRNLRGTIVRHYDGAGVSTSERFDFKGNLLAASRGLARDYKVAADWSALAPLADADAIAAAAAPQLEPGSYATTTRYDALNRVTSLITPDGSEALPTYNEANLLERLAVALRGGAAVQVVSNIDYDRRGRRTLIEYDSGARTEYAYDPLGSRLTRLTTTRLADGARLQDLAYTRDPVGNVVEVADGAQQTVYFANAVVSASAQYEYDALYRLAQAQGRELVGLAVTGAVGWDDRPRTGQPSPSDGQAMQRYTERYGYDAVGNILSMVHTASQNAWNRGYTYATDSNHLLATGDGAYTHDAHGNMTSMPHLASIAWNDRDEMSQVDLGGGGTAYYAYDASGQRVRKVIESLGALVKERIYLGGFEIYRERLGAAVQLERETLHVMDDVQRIALVETLTVDGGVAIAAPAPVVRYQLGNHLGSATLELARDFALVSYEEYFPYGSTSYQTGPGAAEVSLKRYRYTGKERDEETGLYYHGARYCAPWLGRWTAADPASGGGANAYEYVRSNPVRFFDPNGGQEKEAESAPESEEPSGLRYRATGVVDTVSGFGTGLVKVGEGLAGLSLSGVASSFADAYHGGGGGAYGVLKASNLVNPFYGPTKAFQEALKAQMAGRRKESGEHLAVAALGLLGSWGGGGASGATSTAVTAEGVTMQVGEAAFETAAPSALGALALSTGGGSAKPAAAKAAQPQEAEAPAKKAAEAEPPEPEVAEPTPAPPSPKPAKPPPAKPAAAPAPASAQAPPADVVYPEGSFSIVPSYWAEFYPPGAEYQVPPGPFRYLEPAEYQPALELKQIENARIRAEYGLGGTYTDIHEWHPVILGGHPTDWANKGLLARPDHWGIHRTFWDRILNDVRANQ